MNESSQTTSPLDDQRERTDHVMDIGSLLTITDATGDWPLSRLQTAEVRRYSFWVGVLDYIDNSELQYKVNIPIILHNLNLPCPGNISTFVRKIRNKKTQVLNTGDESILDNLVFDEPKLEDLGPACQHLGITRTWLENPNAINTNGHVTRAAVLELKKFKDLNHVSDNKFATWMNYLCYIGDNPHSGTVRLSVKRIECRLRDLVRKYTRNSEDVQSYLNGIYHPPKSSVTSEQCPTSSSSSCTSSRKNNMYQTPLKKPTEKNVNSENVSLLKSEKRELQFDIYKMRSENHRLNSKIYEYKQQLQNLSIRNMNKRIKRRDRQIVKLTGEQMKARKQQFFIQRKITEIKRKYKTRGDLLNYYKQPRVEECKETSTETLSNNIECNETELLKQQVNYLENENEELNETINTLMNTKQVSTFHDGKYSTTVREVYATLLSMNVGVKNVEKVVRTVLSKLADVNVDRLPKKTFSETMLIEAKALAQLQAADAIFRSTNITLHTDGTKRDGQEFGGLQIGTSTGQYSLGIGEMLRGDTESFFNLIKDIFLDIANLVDKDNANQKANIIISRVKNMMTDRHVVNSSLKDQLEQWKNDCLPLITDNFSSFSEPVKKQLMSINHFKCNLHVLVNLGSQAESALKEWEKSISSVSDSPKPDYNNFSTTTSDFIRATTKLCVPGADEKSGYGFLFNTFLQSLNPAEKLHLSSFRGHRINILFSMAAGVFHHIDHITEFINSYFTNKPNKLVSSVSEYLYNNVYLAGCRALGIIDKLFTGPLWRQIEAAPHILELNDMWLTFLKHLEIMSKDASDLMTGNTIYPDFTEKDAVYESLFNVENEELNILTIEALEILCTNFLIIIHRQLGDCLPGGKFHADTAVDIATLREQSSSVSSTNIISERDFANLDRLRREKPNANTIALEGMILFANNKTLKWLDGLENDTRERMVETARRCAPEMILKYKKKKVEMRIKHHELLQKKKEEILRLERQKAAEIAKISSDIEKHGGLWTSESDIHTHLQNMTISEQVDALKCQLRYHKIILKSSPVDKTLLQFSVNGVQFSVKELISHIKMLICDYRIPVRMSVSDDDAIEPSNKDLHNTPKCHIKTKEERNIFMATHRDKIMKKVEEIKRKQSLCTDSDTTVSESKQRKRDN